MDIIVRYFSGDSIKTRYLTSQFIGHTTAKDLLKAFKVSISSLNAAKMLQVSMNGPKTNRKFLDLSQDRNNFDADIPKLLNIGSCGLHVIHGAFTYGVNKTGWKLDGLLQGLWYMFHDTPARREDYITTTGSKQLSAKFCATRWVEDKSVAERAIDVWPNITKYVETTLAGVKSKIPKSASFATVREAVTDLLHFFVSSVASVLQPFLKKYQRDFLVLPLMSEDLSLLFRSITVKFLKQDAVDTTVYKLVKLDVTQSKIQLHVKDIDIGFAATKKILASKEKAKKVSALQILEFRQACLQMLEIIKKLQERSPPQYSLVHAMMSLKTNGGKSR